MNFLNYFLFIFVYLCICTRLVRVLHMFHAHSVQFLFADLQTKTRIRDRREEEKKHMQHIYRHEDTQAQAPNQRRTAQFDWKFCQSFHNMQWISKRDRACIFLLLVTGCSAVVIAKQCSILVKCISMQPNICADVI